ncbi:MAG: hypothetical protein ACI82S_003457, partial [Patiriisocius sp.]
ESQSIMFSKNCSFYLAPSATKPPEPLNLPVRILLCASSSHTIGRRVCEKLSNLFFWRG